MRICIDATNSSDKFKTFLHFLVSTLQLHNFIEWIHYFIVKLLKFCQSNTDLAEIEYEKSIKIIVENYYNTETVVQFVMFTLCKVARKTHVHTLRRFDEFFKKHHCKVWTWVFLAILQSVNMKNTVILLQFHEFL